MAAILAGVILKRIFLNASVRIPIQISLTFVPSGLVANEPALDQILAWCRKIWQAITWTNADPIHWLIYDALGGDELIELR